MDIYNLRSEFEELLEIAHDLSLYRDGTQMHKVALEALYKLKEEFTEAKEKQNEIPF
jgi:hypothetical protein